jgi:hypothetical protein
MRDFAQWPYLETARFLPHLKLISRFKLVKKFEPRMLIVIELRFFRFLKMTSAGGRKSSGH